MNLTNFLRQRDGQDNTDKLRDAVALTPRHKVESETSLLLETEESKGDCEQEEEQVEFDADPNSHLGQENDHPVHQKRF